MGGLTGRKSKEEIMQLCYNLRKKRKNSSHFQAICDFSVPPGTAKVKREKLGAINKTVGNENL